LLAIGSYANDGIAQVDSQSEIPAKKPEIVDRKKIILLKERESEKGTEGVTLGSFTFTPSISLIEYYDDNIFATESQTLDDFVTVVIPAVNVKSNWKEHSLRANAGAEISRYAEFSSENTSNYWLNASGRYDVSKKQNIFGGLGYERKHEDRASPEAEAGEEPTKYDEYSANAGYTAWYGNHQVKLAYSFLEYDFMDVPSLGTVIPNDDRDRAEHGIGLRYQYSYSKKYLPFIQIVQDKRDYKLTPDYAGNDRNSDGTRLNVGLNIKRNNTRTRIFAGRLERTYDSPAFEDPSETDFGLDHRWKISDNMGLRFNVSRSIQETTLDGSPGYLLTDGTVQFGYRINDANSLKLTYARASADYYQILREDLYENYVIGYSRKIIDQAYLNVDLQKGQRDSNIPGDDYTINQIFFTIKAVI
jgi:hypothetical protein